MPATAEIPEFLILGPLEARLDGRPVVLRGAKQRALLAALLLYPGQVLSVERLIDDLWGEAPPQSAANALQVYVSQLRRRSAPARSSLRRPGTSPGSRRGSSTQSCSRASSTRAATPC